MLANHLAHSQMSEHQEEVALGTVDRDFSTPSLYHTPGEFTDFTDEVVYLEGTLSVTF